MQIKIFQGHSHELGRSHFNVVIDVIRAFTVAHYAFVCGAREILLADSTAKAFSLRNRYPEYILAGEEKGVAIEGFDLDNSPQSLGGLDLNGKTLVQKTTNGVRAALNSLDAGQVLVTGFSNARTTAEYLLKSCSSLETAISLIASHPDGDDDLACAEYIKGILEKTGFPSADAVSKRIQQSRAAEKFYDKTQPEFQEEDIDICAKELPSDFVMAINKDRRIPTIEKVKL